MNISFCLQNRSCKIFPDLNQFVLDLQQGKNCKEIPNYSGILSKVLNCLDVRM